MAFDKVVVSAEEISKTTAVADGPPSSFAKLPSPVPIWARIILSALVLVLPILGVVTIILRIAFRNQPPRVKYAWVSFLSTLLVISSFLATAATVLLISFVPIPAMVSSGLGDLDERSEFPALPSTTDLSTTDISRELKPLVIVVSPAARLWSRQEVPSAVFGAGVLLHADKSGYLFATANHVANGGGWGSGAQPGHVLVATASGVWATGNVIATAEDLDLALLWVARSSGAAEFVQPVAPVREGAAIYVIGHPEGLKFTLSTGIISGLRDQFIQISAPVSPGNSGGPVYDGRGNLIGIVSSKFDRNRDANAENLGFAARADAFLQLSNWSFRNNGRQLLGSYIEATGNKGTPASSAEE